MGQTWTAAGTEETNKRAMLLWFSSVPGLTVKGDDGSVSQLVRLLRTIRIYICFSCDLACFAMLTGIKIFILLSKANATFAAQAFSVLGQKSTSSSLRVWQVPFYSNELGHKVSRMVNLQRCLNQESHTNVYGHFG